MTDKVLAYALYADQKAKEIASSQRKWTDFLHTASRMYKYSYYDQLLIHAQRPDATACASYEIWNQRMNRYIRRGSKGIGLLDTDGDELHLRYVFDVSDTGVRPNSLPVEQWRLTEENETAVAWMLSREYGIPDNIPVADQIEMISTMLTRDYWMDHRQEIGDLDKVDGTIIAAYDRDTIGAAFRRAAAVSTAYTLMLRCGEPVEKYFSPEDFKDVFDFNTPEAIATIGSAVSISCGQVLRQIEKTIRSTERSNEEHDRTDLHPARGLSAAEPERGRSDSAAGDVRTDAQELPEGAPAGSSEPAGGDREAVPAPDGDRQDGAGEVRSDDAAPDEAEQRDGEPESVRPDEVGRDDEQPPTPDRGDDPGRAGVQLTEEPGSPAAEDTPAPEVTAQSVAKPSDSQQLNLFDFTFPTEADQITSIDQAESALFAPFAFSVAQEDIDHILRAADNTTNHRMLIVAEFSKQKSLEELAPILARVYHDGYGIEGAHGKVAAWFAEDGIHLSSGRTARYLKTAQIVSWTDAARRIGEMLEAGTFATNVEVAAALGHERHLLAQGMWSITRALSEDAVNTGYLPSFYAAKGRVATEGEEAIEAMLADRDRLPFLIEECGNFLEAYRNDRTLMNYRLYNTENTLIGVTELAFPRVEFDSDMPEVPACGHFITDDEINEVLGDGGNIYGAKGRIYEFFTQRHTDKEKIDFLKNAYGIGGRAPGVSGALHSDEWHDSKGIRLKKQRCEDVLIKWNKVAQRVDEMIRKGRYLSPEALQLWREQQAAKEEPEDHPAYQPLREPMQEEIELAIQEWNGDVASKREVMRHFRERSIDAEGEWLKAIYGDDMPAMPISGDGYGTDLPWSEVHWRTLRLIEEDRFFTDEEQDMFEDIDTTYVREQLEDRGVVLDAAPDQHERDAAGVTYTTEEVYDPEDIGLGFEVIVQSMHFDKPEHTPSTEVDAAQPAEGDTPVSIQIGGEWQEFPNAAAAERAAYEEDKANIRRNARNFQITDENLGTGGAKAKYQANITAIRLLKHLEEDDRQALPEQQEVLARYVGWGGLADVFDPSKENWRNEYAELKELLTPEEYDAARASTLNAHYTSPTVIRAIYETVARMGFDTGNILEPAMGVGNFFGLLPSSMSSSHLYGVELDSVTGRIAKQLYPKADITVAGFETTDRRDFFDLAVGNVPFGNYQVNDKAYNKLGFSIHDYFFAKTLDQVRPGGVIAFVTSRYTLDKQTPDVRRYIAQRAEFLGAVRLPNNAFKANAGTDVVSDIVFLQKRDRPIEIDPDWVHLGTNPDGFAINSYFVDHPEMILGHQTSESTQYGRQDFTVEPIEGANLAVQLASAMQNIRGQYVAPELPELEEGESIRKTIPADPDVKNYSYTVIDGEVYYRDGSVMVQPDLNATAQERVKGLVQLRACVNALIELQMQDATDTAIAAQQSELNTLYDTFTARHGLISSRANNLAFANDSSYYLLCSLEELDEQGALKRKADIFSKRTIRPHQVVDHVDTAEEALAVSLAERAKVDMAYMAELSGIPADELPDKLSGSCYKLPYSMDVYATADEYLSGNVRDKLREAREAAAQDPSYEVNVRALEAVQPKDLEASEIDVRLGATWVNKEYIQQFMFETFHTPPHQQHAIQVEYSPHTAEWHIAGKSIISANSVAAYHTFGTDRASAYRILEDTLNLRDVRIYDVIEDAEGRETRVLNQKDTMLAQQKQQAIKDAFQEWIWRDPDRRHDLVQLYNEQFNSIRPREYDGQYITFGGMNPSIELRPHQRNAIAHVLYGGNTLLAHQVGAGKTFEMVASAMESKRLGLCHKSMFVVPNHLTEQWASEFLRLYPAANILVTTKKDFEKSRRKKFCARIATGDYDAVIIGHSQFERIPISRERQERLLQSQINEITEGIEELKSSRGERFSIKQLEKARKQLKVRLEKLQAEDKKDDVITFEQLGVDRLFVDEAHNFKNMFCYTKMRNVAGLSTTEAQKSSDMFAKCRYMDELTGNRGVIFATGTPVSNSMTEMYTMQRYLQYDTLRSNGMTHFDCWASTFGETVTAIELAPEGTGYRARTRFAHFFNLPELMTMFKEVADIKTADQLNLPTPNAHYEVIAVKPTPQQQEIVQSLSERAALIHNASVDPSVDNMLKVTSDGRKLGLDQRLINPLLPDDPMSKVNACVANVYRIWQEGGDQRLTQLIFCDISTPKGTGEAKEFSVYDDIRGKLIAMGIPAEQIAFIHDANSEAKKKDLFSKVNAGDVRILMGSTAKMGAGTNVQRLLVASHDLDCPWRPGDLEQRAGRIVRQGNTNSDVYVYRYVTEGSFDSYLWQTVENKQRFISQIMTSKSPVRSCEDVDETALSYAEIKALCAGDERIREKMDLDVDVARLRLMKADHQSRQYQLEDRLLRYFPGAIEQAEKQMQGFEADLQTLTANPNPDKEFVGIEIHGHFIADRHEAGKAILACCKDAARERSVEIGHYRGFAMSIAYDSFANHFNLTLHGQMHHVVELGPDARGNMVRMDNALAAIPSRMDVLRDNLTNLRTQQSAAKEELGKPFPHEEELKAKSARLAVLDAELNIDKPALPAEDRVAKSARPSIRDQLKAPCRSGQGQHKKKRETEAR